jgi:D-ribose pyranase
VRRNGILNHRLAGAIAALGHGDMLLVVDAGFPIPRGADRVDLAVLRDLPDLRTVLSAIHRELIVERVVFASEMAENNAPLHGFLEQEFRGVELEGRPHVDMLGGAAAEAKTIVRTGAFDPWGNIGLVSGVDVPAWFGREGVVMPESYEERFAEMSRDAAEGRWAR